MIPRLLIVDDDPIDRKLFRRYLEQGSPEGSFSIEEAESVRAARRRLLNGHFDCVLLDHLLLDGTAFDLLRFLNQRTSAPPVVVLTGNNDEQLALELLANGADDYLLKDRLSGQALTQAVRFAIARHQAPRFHASGPVAPPVAPPSGIRPWTERLRGEVHGYRIDGMLGAGAMGAVFEAVQLSLGRKVAIKVIPPLLAKDPESMQRFEQEARILACFDSPFIIPIYDMFQHEQLYCIVMAFADGGSVEGLLQRERRVSPRRATGIVRDAALGLFAASSQGIVHRDIKPGNLLLSARGQVRIADFGLAKLSRNAQVLTAPGIVLGSAAYMAPEQWYDTAELDTRCDLYALGCTLFHLLTGRLPFVSNSPEEMMRFHLESDPPEVSDYCADCPTALADIARKLLEKAPERRYQDGSKLARDLHACLTARSRAER